MSCRNWLFQITAKLELVNLRETCFVKHLVVQKTQHPAEMNLSGRHANRSITKGNIGFYIANMLSRPNENK